MVYYDNHPDNYEKQHEVVQKISNSFLANLENKGVLKKVRKADSRSFMGIQAANFLTGAITAAHNLYLDTDMDINTGKRTAISHLAHCLSWDDLGYDTYPDERFNIWNFPKEWRGATGGSKNIKLDRGVPYVTAKELESRL